MGKQQSIITQVEFARVCGVSRQLVGAAVKNGKIKVNRKRKIIFDDPLNILWLENHQVKNLQPNASQAKSEKSKPQELRRKGKSLAEIKIEEEIRKIRADIRLKDLKYSQSRGELIEKDKLATVLFKYLDALNIAVLDTPDMIIDMLIDGVKAGLPRGDLIKLMRDKLQAPISSTKRQIKERLR